MTVSGPLMKRRNDDYKPWGLIVALVIAAAAGLISIPLQFATFRNLDTATSQDVERNQRLVQQVKMLEEINSRNVDNHRAANDEAHAEQCRIIYDIAVAAGIVVQPCQFKRYEAHPAPSPS